MFSYNVLTHNIQSCKTDVESIRNTSAMLSTCIDCIQNFLPTKEDQYKTLMSDQNEFFNTFLILLQNLSQKKERLLHLTETFDARHSEMLNTLSDFSECFSNDTVKNSKILNTLSDAKDGKDHEDKSLHELCEKTSLVKFTLDTNEGNEENFQDKVVKKKVDVQEGEKLMEIEYLDSIRSQEEKQKFTTIGEVKVKVEEDNSQESIEENEKDTALVDVKNESVGEHSDEKFVFHEGQSDSFQSNEKRLSQIPSDVLYSKMKGHENTAHNAEIQQRVSCDICGKNYSNRQNMNMHRKTHTEDKHICSICDHTFTHKSNLVNHIHSHSEGQSYKCPDCPKTFPHQSTLSLHARFHSSKEACEICSKNISIHHLKRHMLTHGYSYSNEKRHTCIFCQKTFARRDHLTRHERIHTGDKPYACDFCDMKFSSSWHRNRHLKTHRNIELNPSSETVAEYHSSLIINYMAENH